MSKMAKLLYLWAILGCGVAWAQPAMDIAKRGLALGSQVPLYSFRMSSGVYVGEVDSYTVLDLNLTYQLPIEQDLVLQVDASNVLNQAYQSFVGAPAVGRLVFGQVGLRF